MAIDPNKPDLTAAEWAARAAGQRAREKIIAENPFDGLVSSLAFASKDWSLDRPDAWVYGIVCGWDDESLAELAEKHGWTPEGCERLKRLHQKFIAAAKTTDSLLCHE